MKPGPSFDELKRDVIAALAVLALVYVGATVVMVLR
jgi:hypothetical protein